MRPGTAPAAVFAGEGFLPPVNFVGTDVLGCPIVVLSKSKQYIINRIMSFCHALLTSFVGRGLAPAGIFAGEGFLPPVNFVWTGVPDCSIMVLSKSRKINLDTIKP